MTRKKLFNLADSAVQQWRGHAWNRKFYDLSHLDAHVLYFQHPQRNERYTLYFTYSHHVFTRKHKPCDDLDMVSIYLYPTDLRIFDQERYQLSLSLPNIIHKLPDQLLFHGGYSRYCSCKMTTADGRTIYYQVVYRVWRGHGKLRFHIESAYPLNDKPRGIKKVDFWVICHNLLRGRELPKPPVP